MSEPLLVVQEAKKNREVVRKVKMGRYAFEDKLGGYFKNFAFIPPKRPFEKQLLNVEEFASEGPEDREVEPWDLEATRLIRVACKDLARFINVSCFRTGPILADEDKFAVLLPTQEHGGNTSGFDALTYNQPQFDELMTQVAKNCEKVATTEEEFESLKHLFINYATPYPRTVAICHDGRVKAGVNAYKPEELDFIGKMIWPYLSEAFHKSSMKGAISLNITKSPGFPKIWPDGSPLKADEQCYINFDYADKQKDKFLRRRNYKEFKMAWLRAGVIETNLDFLLGNLSWCNSIEGLVYMFRHYFCNAASWGLRMNNGDTPVVDHWSDILKDNSSSGKNRPAVFELKDGRMRSMVLDTKRWTGAYNKLNGTTKAALKPRYMYPAPNATYAIPFNGLFKRLIGCYEGSASGFPSLNIHVLNRYERNYKMHADRQVYYLQFDRSNSEQFITDNFDLILSLFPKAFAELLLFIGTSLLPSDYGPRVVKGGLPSGSPATTFLNMMMGLAENTMQLLEVCGIPSGSAGWMEGASKILKCVFESEDAIELNGVFVLPNWGTDDQIAVLWPIDRAQLKDPKVEGRSLGADIVEKATVFGLDFDATGVRVSRSLNIDKFHVQEHLKTGDAMALKMAMRFRIMEPKFYDAIASAFFDLGYGDIADFDNGIVAYGLILSEYGYAPDPIFNEFNPTDSITYHQVMEKYEGESNLVPDEFCEKYDALLDGYFSKNNL